MYRERMNSYYPQVIQNISEFQAIIDGEYSEFEELEKGNERVISDAYLLTMTEDRIIEWEKNLGIRPLESATIEDRRNNVIARIRGQGKLNTSVINTIVKTLTGEGCKCWIEDSTIYVELLPFDESKISLEDSITNITKELSLKIPAHLNLNVDLAYVHWSEINENNNSWTAVKATHGTWENVMFGKTTKANMLDTSKLDEFYLG